jgi:hypothetical protein
MMSDTTNPSAEKVEKCKCCGHFLLPKETWIMPHPGTGELISVDSFKIAMDKYFEGFNIPRQVIGGRVEPFEHSYDRVTEYYK